MTILRIDRFTVDPASRTELLSRYAALAVAAKRAFPGLQDTRLAQVDDENWLTVWRWDSLASAKAAIDEAPSIPEAGAAFALTKDLAVEFAEIIDA